MTMLHPLTTEGSPENLLVIEYETMGKITADLRREGLDHLASTLDAQFEKSNLAGVMTLVGKISLDPATRNTLKHVLETWIAPRKVRQAMRGIITTTRRAA